MPIKENLIIICSFRRTILKNTINLKITNSVKIQNIMNDTTYKTSRVLESTRETERINRLKERVNTVQKKLNYVEQAEKSTRKLFNLIDNIESPVKLLKDTSNNSINLSMSRNFMNDIENDGSNYNFANKSQFIEELNLSQIYPTDDRTKVLKDILLKMEMYRNNTPSQQKILNYFHQKIENNHPYYYNFLKDTNPMSLRVLIQILYEEIETLCNFVNRNDNTFNFQVASLEKKLEEKNILCDKFTEEIIAKNFEIEALKKKLDDFADKSKLSLFFVELRVLFQNLLDEILQNIQPISHDLRISYKHLILSTLEQISKFDSEVNGDDPYSQENSRVYKIEDRNALFFMQGHATKRTGEGITPSFNDSNMNYKKDNNKLLLTQLEQENKRLKAQIEELTQRNYDEPKSNSNSSVLIGELRKAINEKEAAEAEAKKFRQAYHESREEFATLSTQILKSNTERESINKNFNVETEDLKKKIQSLIEENNSIEEKFRLDINQLETEVKKSRDKIVHLLEEKSLIEKEAFDIKVEKKEITNKIYLYEGKFDELKREKEGLIQNISNLERIIKEKTEEIEKLKHQKSNNSYEENGLIKLEEQQQLLAEKKQVATLEIQLLTLQKELHTTKDTLKEAQDKLRELEEDKKIYTERREADKIDVTQTSSFIMEQLAMIILSKNTKKLDQETRNKIQAFLEPLQAKFKILESFKRKYQERVIKSLTKSEDIRALGGLILQAIEVISRSYNSQIPATLIMLKEELEQKKSTVNQKIKESTNDIEADTQELKNLAFEKDSNSLYDEMDVLSPTKNDEVFKLKEENENLKNKLQTQSYEMQAIKSQLKLAATLEDSKRPPIASTSRDNPNLSRSQKLAKKDLQKSKNSVVFEDEDENIRVMNEISSQNDLLLMLHSQASSLEMMINNEY